MYRSIRNLKPGSHYQIYIPSALNLNSPIHHFYGITMPKSKRAKVVHTSRTQKKGKELTLKLHANIRECIPKYPYLYVFRVDNMRNTYLKDVRTQLSSSRYCYS